MPRERLGVALLVPEPYSLEIDGLRRALGDGSLGRIAPHLTLVPPVNVAAADLDRALAVVRDAAGASSPIRAELGPPQSFHPDNPVVFLAVGAGSEEVASLRERVFKAPLARPLTWPFVPHVTLADDIDPARIEPALHALAEFRAQVTFERVHVLREGEGRVWSPIGDALLARRRVVGEGGLPLELTVSEHADAAAASWARAAWHSHRISNRSPYPAYPSSEAFAVTARRENQVVGLAEGRFRGADCDLDRLIVGPAERGQGIGSHLLATVESLAAERRCGRCRLETVSGGPAEGFYRDRGWVVTGRLSDWRGGADFARMERRITPVNRTG